LSWFITAALLLVVLPYAVGFLYAILALPLHAVACEGATGLDAILGRSVRSINEIDYLTFLAGKGCKFPQPPLDRPSCNYICRADDPQCAVNKILCQSLGSIDESYRGVHQYFNDDFIGALFRYMGDAYFNAAVTGTRFAISLHNSSPLFRAIVWLFLLVCGIAFPVAIRRLATRIADHIFDWWEKAR
jgi:hypothetical protein